MRPRCASGAPVSGDVFLPRENQSSILLRSYVLPSAAITGCCISSIDMVEDDASERPPRRRQRAPPRRKTPIASLGAFHARRRPSTSTRIDYQLTSISRSPRKRYVALLPGRPAFLVPYSTLALTASRRASCAAASRTAPNKWPTSSRAPRRRHEAHGRYAHPRRSKYAPHATSSRRRPPRRLPKTRGIWIMMTTATAVCASARRGSSAARSGRGGRCSGSLDQIGVVCYVRIL